MTETLRFDYKNAWYATNYDQESSRPIVHKKHSLSFTDKLIKNGTWSNSTTRTNHTLIIPELELRIPHWFEFTQSFAYEPFLKLHSYATMSAEEISAQAHTTWNGKHEDTVLMRTAAFGSRQRVLDVCIQDGKGTEENTVVKNGLGDDMLVPLSLIWLYRIQFAKEKLRRFSSWHGDYDVTNANQIILT